ncbi:peptidylprolyl isomerase [Catenulispora sp. NL8]|uniref:Peptidyl-prolyl cis-trans isomerase n=2 Tax=Catenulispora pinistramenti TaxID=2705254 RepID=A0ABS5L1Y2_9ACTN|nr:peptidylprolyl isomerase [Catenulispora pinistramenti]
MLGIGAFAAAAGLLLSGCASTGTIGSADGSPVTAGSPASAPDTASTSASASDTDSASASDTASAPDTASTSAPGASGGAKSWASEPPMTIDPAKAYTMTLHTNQGDIVISLNAAKAPHTVNSFNFLAGQKFFDGSHCHRLVTTGIYVLQCGDPTGTGTGGPGYQFQDENLAGATYPTGTVAMANAGPNTNGSQFFLVYKDSTLPPSYTPFGTVASGLDVVTKIAAGGEDDSNGAGDGRPKIDVVLNSVTVAAG